MLTSDVGSRSIRLPQICAQAPAKLHSKRQLLARKLPAQVVDCGVFHIRQLVIIIGLCLLCPIPSSILGHLLSIQRSVRAQAGPIALPAMTEDFKVVVNEPVEVLALGPQRSRKTLAGLRVVCWRIGVVAVVFLVLVAGKVHGDGSRRGILCARFAQQLSLCGIEFRIRREVVGVGRLACGGVAIGRRSKRRVLEGCRGLIVRLREA